MLKLEKIASLTSYKQQETSWQIDTENVSLSNRETFSTESKIICIRWYNSQKRLLQFIGNCYPKKSSVILGWQTLEYKCNHNGNNYQDHLRTLTLPLKYDRSLVGYLQVAVTIEPLQYSLARSRLFLALGVPITLGFYWHSGLDSWWFGNAACQTLLRTITTFYCRCFP